MISYRSIGFRLESHASELLITNRRLPPWAVRGRPMAEEIQWFRVPAAPSTASREPGPGELVDCHKGEHGDHPASLNAGMGPAVRRDLPRASGASDTVFPQLGSCCQGWYLVLFPEREVLIENYRICRRSWTGHLPFRRIGHGGLSATS